MLTFLIVLISLVALFIILIVLLQSGKGGGLAAEFGGASSSTDSIVGGRQAATLLTRASWISGGIFLALALMVGILSSRSTTAPSSILRTEFQTPTGTPASVLNSESGLSTPVPLDGSDATSTDAPLEVPVGDESED
ncbi:MAG: preprotein translocase subunit SecG [Gemmatimonadales bacterium]|nr:MAG: preprotein translocase subunit SecG [Gemmatimonadales bacterium]